MGFRELLIQQQGIEEGGLVEVYDSQNNFGIALGHCQMGSIIVRVLSFEPTNDTFWENAYKKPLINEQQFGLKSENNNIFSFGTW